MTAAAVEVPDEAAAPAFAAAGAILRRTDRDAYLASYFLPKRKRHAAWAVLAFCQMIREAVASPETTLENARGMREHPAVVSPQHIAAVSGGAASACGCGSEVDERVAMFRDRLGEIYDRRVELPAVEKRSKQQHAIEAVGRVVHDFELPKQLFLDLADGLRADTCVRRYATWTSLQKHCYGVSGVVSVILCGVLGVTHSDAAGPAAALGNAVRLAQILRHLPDDLRAGKIYLPLEDLVQCRVTEQELMQSATPPKANVLGLIGFEVARARDLLKTAATGICWLAEDGSRLAASAMVVRCAAVLDMMESYGFDVFSRCPELGGVQKLRRLPAAWRLARRHEGEPLPRLH